MQKCEDNVAARLNGNALQPLAGILVTVTDDATSLPASLYSDDGVTALPQPLVTDDNGYYGFYAANGEYTLTFTGVRITTFTRKVVLADPSDNPYATKAELAAGSGSSLITFLQAGAGAVPRDLQARGRDTVSVLDFMSEAERADCALAVPLLDHTASIQAAIDAANVVFVPPGNYRVSSLKVNKNNFTLYGAGYNRSIITSTVAANVAIEVASTANVSGFNLRNIKLQGNATNLGAIKLGTATFSASIVSLENLFIDGFSNATAGYGYAIQACSVQELDIHNVWMQHNKNAFHRPNLGYCTSTKFSGKKTYFGLSTNNGMLIEGQCDDIYVNDAVFEGNQKEAVVVTNTALSGPRGVRLWINSAYFEANLDSGTGGAGQGVISVTGGSGSYEAHRLVLENCEFAENPNAPAGTKNIKLDRTIAYIGKNVLIPTDVATTATCSVRFDSNRYPNGGNYLAGYRALAGVITATDFTDPATGTDLDQVNLVRAVTFPTSPRLVTDPNTLDDYTEGTWTPALSSDGTPPTYTLNEAVDGTFTKIGNFVFARGKVRANISAIGTGTPRITGLPYQPKGLEPAIMSLTTAMNTLPGPNYMVTGPYLFLSGATYKVTSDGYLVFSVTYQAA